VDGPLLERARKHSPAQLQVLHPAGALVQAPATVQVAPIGQLNVPTHALGPVHAVSQAQLCEQSIAPAHAPLPEQSTLHGLAAAHVIAPAHESRAVQSMSQEVAAVQSIPAAHASRAPHTTWQARPGGHTTCSGQPVIEQSITHIVASHDEQAGGHAPASPSPPPVVVVVGSPVVVVGSPVVVVGSPVVVVGSPVVVVGSTHQPSTHSRPPVQSDGDSHAYALDRGSTPHPAPSAAASPAARPRQATPPHVARFTMTTPAS
jgi:hypothetical protein